MVKGQGDEEAVIDSHTLLQLGSQVDVLLKLKLQILESTNLKLSNWVANHMWLLSSSCLYLSASLSHIFLAEGSLVNYLA